MELTTIEATDIPDLWFQALGAVIDKGRRKTIAEGSFASEGRIELDYFTGRIKFPGTRPLLPQIPAHLNIPDPVDKDYIEGDGNGSSYLTYMMTSEKMDSESYTYGERIAGGEKSQINTVIDRYKSCGPCNNQLIMTIAKPEDIHLEDPPCLRHIDTRVEDGKLHFIVYFRSWDLWSGLPANLAGLQYLKEYMSLEIGVDDGEMIVSSKGLHLYKYSESLALKRLNRNG